MKGKQTKNNSNDFRATDSEFWKKQHGYDDKKAEKASDWMSKHYSDLGEAVKINECGISQLVAEALKRCLNRLNETEYTSLKSKDTSKGKVGVSKDEDDNYYVDYDGKHYHVPSQKDADKWHEILSIDESHIRNIVSEALVKLISESSIGEVDKHQLYAWYANERNKQANGERGLSTAQQRLGTTSDQLRKKSEIGKNNAVNAFNKKYKRGWNSQGDSFSTGMGDNYSITTNQEFNSHDKDGIPLQTKTTNVFDPYNDSEKHHQENYENGALKSTSDYETPKSLPDGPRYTATHGPERVAARKMALGRLDEKMKRNKKK